MRRMGRKKRRILSRERWQGRAAEGASLAFATKSIPASVHRRNRMTQKGVATTDYFLNNGKRKACLRRKLVTFLSYTPRRRNCGERKKEHPSTKSDGVFYALGRKSIRAAQWVIQPPADFLLSLSSKEYITSSGNNYKPLMMSTCPHDTNTLHRRQGLTFL